MLFLRKRRGGCSCNSGFRSTRILVKPKQDSEAQLLHLKLAVSATAIEMAGLYLTCRADFLSKMTDD